MNKAFTLIELLVVITIIVVLLALLTPALDKAIYQTELTQCAANMKGVTTGITTYAASNKRQYPDRPALRVEANTMNVICSPNYDDREISKAIS